MALVGSAPLGGTKAAEGAGGALDCCQGTLGIDAAGAEGISSGALPPGTDMCTGSIGCTCCTGSTCGIERAGGASAADGGAIGAPSGISFAGSEEAGALFGQVEG
jgi:hypothetical protein